MGRRSRQVADAHRRREAALERSNRRYIESASHRQHVLNKGFNLACIPPCEYCAQDAHDKRIENLRTWEHDLNTTCSCETCTAVTQLQASTQQPKTAPSANSSSS